MVGFALMLDSEKLEILNTTPFLPIMPYKANHYDWHFGFLTLSLKKKKRITQIKLTTHLSLHFFPSQ